MSTPPPRYRAFLSYSHQDARIVARLHRRLESYRVPRSLRRAQADRQELRARLGPVFRDREDLASATRLSGSIEAALAAADALVVVCSPAAVASPWVGQEIRYFRQQHPQRPVLAFVVAGDPGADPRLAPELAAFPLELLRDAADPDGALLEPLAADARADADGFGAAFLKLAAGLLDVPYDALRQREMRRRQRRWSVVVAASLLLSALMLWLAWDATRARDAARRSQAQAELELESERQTRNFLLSVFELADAERSRGDQVTVREVLDRAVSRIDATRFARPAIKSRFLTTMGQAYSSLGLYRRSIELMQQSLDLLSDRELSPEAWSQRIDSQIELGDVLFNMGDYDAALRWLAPLIDDSGLRARATPLQRARAANVRGDVLAYTEHDADAKLAYETARAAIEAVALEPGEAALVRGRSALGLGLLAQFGGDHAAADGHYADAIAQLEPVLGELHPASIQAIGSRGSNAYASGDSVSARAAWTRALVLARQVYDESGPEIGTLKNNLGLLLLETGDLQEAETLLRAALLSDRAHRSEHFDDLSYSLNNLAWTRRFQGDTDEARVLWQEALPIAESANHPMLSPILTGLAELDCEDHAIESGTALARRAVDAAHAQHGADHWRSAAAELALSLCRARAGETIDAQAVARREQQLRARWPAPSPLRSHATEIRTAIGRASAARTRSR